MIAEGVPGEVVWASVCNGLEDATHTGKVRPVILTRREGGHFWVCSLTTQPIHKTSGVPRRQILDPSRLGLAAPSFVWSSHLMRVSALDVGDHIGWIDHAALTLIAQVEHLWFGDLQRMREVASRHHGYAWAS